MALVKCDECGKAVSTRAKACPHCGAQRGGDFGMIVAILVLITVGGAFGWTKYQETNRAKAAEERIAAELEGKAAAARVKRSPRENAARVAAGAQMLRKSLRNPEHTRLQSALLVDVSGVICYEYEMPNAFGGMVTGRALLQAEATQVLNSEMDGFAKTWGQECDKRKGTQLASVINWPSL